MPRAPATSAASHRRRGKRRVIGAHGTESLPRGRSHLLAFRSFTLRFALAAPRHRRRKRRLGGARRPAPSPRRRSGSVVSPSRFLALRPFVLRYLLAAGASTPCRRRKASVIDMGHYISRLLRETRTGEGGSRVRKRRDKGLREVIDLSANRVQADKANPARWGIGDVSNITLEEVPDDSLEEDLSELFAPLTNEEESEVNNLLNGSSHSKKVIVLHKPSNIEITKEKLWCLRPRGWLNDEVINLYLELLKERAEREPNRFLKCHFFNTFFYKKLACGKTGYDYQSVRRWTTPNKLGYRLAECEKIFIPVHRDVHWCLAIIDMKEETFHYLDSLGGKDSAVLRILARYIVDELKDKNDIEIDTSSWREVSVHIPLQHNGWDCGMFMLKFIDFYSRGLILSFSQEHMEYFRRRTAKEILRLRAD
ncbi:ubiquitin-like-specific protease 1A [Triticum dicoccoides]|uniref:ubiquitin-like-specific protease 1A n=1 Tax=Triticum dicoccoides TaxID=85692 RepID=UPI00188FDC63|nr:ubiquitin-like-specific protease 1A [Triticum dicoccoides]